MGSWANLSVMEAHEAAAFDLAQFSAIDGDAGGTWAPASLIILGGSAGLRMDSPFLATGHFQVDSIGNFSSNVVVTHTIHAGGTIDSDADITATGNVSALGSGQIGGTFNADGAATFGSTGHFHGNLDTDGTLHAGGNATLAGTLTTTGGAVFSSTVGINGNVSTAADVGVGGELTVADVSEFTGRATFNGGVVNRVVLGTNGNNTYSVAIADEVIVGQTGISSDVIYTLSSTGAVNGSRIRFTNLDGSWNVTVVWATGSQRVTYQIGEVMTLEMVYIGGTWYQSLLIRRTS
jgi:hypothetical protein